MFEMLLNGFSQVLLPSNLIYLFAGVFLGLVLGAIPGLTATMAIALIIPLTFTLSPTQSIIMLLGAFNAGTFGGSLSAILLSTPGTPAAAATVADGFALAKQGKAGKAIKTALFSSVFGCLFSCVILVVIAEPIAAYAIKFGPAEYTVLMIFSLSIIASASGDSMIKGMIGGFMGLLFGVVGMDPIFSLPRLTFDNVSLSSGINLITMLIGALAVAEILVQVEDVARGHVNAHLPQPKTRDDTIFSLHDLGRVWKIWLKSSAIGCGIGALPGLGSSLACYVGYDAAQRSSKHPEEFGHGSIEGVAAAESANNAVCGANMIPLLTLGVPGDTATAILIGAFLIQGLTPGPLIFQEAPQVVYNIYSGVMMSNLVLVLVTFVFYRLFTSISKIKTTIIFPCVCMCCIVGVYALNQNLADVWIMIFFSAVGYVMAKFKFPPACMLIGFILSPIMEKNYRLALLIGNGDYKIFFSTPLTWILWAITAFSLFSILRGKRKKKALAVQVQ